MKPQSRTMELTIGQLARQSDTVAQTIRYYERQGLLSKPIRTESNYRVYGNEAVIRLTFIKRAKKIGFSLNDIKVLLGMADGEVVRCAKVKKFAETRLTKIRSQLTDLKAMEKTLANLVNQCAEAKEIKKCPILETLTKKK